MKRKTLLSVLVTRPSTLDTPPSGGCSLFNQPMDFEQPDQKSGQSLCRQTTTHSLRAAQLEDLIPGCSREVSLQSAALESGLPEPKAAAAAMFRDSPAETRFNNGPYGCLLPVRQLAHFFIKTVWYPYGCLHIVSHVTLYGKMSRYSKKHGWAGGMMEYWSNETMDCARKEVSSCCQHSSIPLFHYPMGR